MDFVDDVDFVFAFGWCNDCALTQIANIVYAGIACGVDFDDVEIIVFKFVFEAINFVGENAGDGCFAGSAWADKKVGVGDFAIFDGMGKNVCDLRLSNNLIQTAWSVPPVQRLHSFYYTSKKEYLPADTL
jgi:hypothetical protein